MSYRRHLAKPSVALWMLVALGDALLILTSLGVLALIVLAGVVALSGAGWLLLRRGAAADEAAAVPVGSRTARQRASA
jgi:hypothetical protein